jgi:hypothetical protein
LVASQKKAEEVETEFKRYEPALVVEDSSLNHGKSFAWLFGIWVLLPYGGSVISFLFFEMSCALAEKMNNICCRMWWSLREKLQSKSSIGCEGQWCRGGRRSFSFEAWQPKEKNKVSVVTRLMEENCICNGDAAEWAWFGLLSWSRRRLQPVASMMLKEFSGSSMDDLDTRRVCRRAWWHKQK